MAQLVRAEAPAFEEAATDRDIALSVAADTTALVCGHAEMLREVVINLMDNAVKYTPAGRVDVRVRRNDEAVTLEVADTGVGMTPAERTQATDRFFRAASVNTVDVAGSGLGLALVDQIVRWHGGTLNIASEPGDGTTVTVRLPRAVDAMT
jgi:signal transduction histidine kinase